MTYHVKTYYVMITESLYPLSHKTIITIFPVA